MPGSAEPLLPRLLRAAEYEVQMVEGSIHAYRPRDRRAVQIVRLSRLDTDIDRGFPPEALHRALILDEEPGPALRDHAANKGIELVGPSALGPALGEILLVADIPEPDPRGLPLEPPALPFPAGERLVRPRIDRADAERIAGVDGFRCTLRLVPFYVAQYRARVPAPEGLGGQIIEQLVAVHALTGHADFWVSGQRDLVAELDVPHQRLEPTLDERRARHAAEVALRLRHTAQVDHTEQHDGALVIERRRVAPGPDDLVVGPFTVIHVPYWYVEGADGRVVVDAVTGARDEPPGPGK
ncbi:MAG: hypothetical protein L3K03_06035 [Thermoplasmata archaeon]|nr:hypothetical protein [Thermoplasmata archaeon]